MPATATNGFVPKGAGFLHVRSDRREGLHPNVISHGYNACSPGRSRFHDLFDWVGTIDPTPWMCVGEAIRYLGTLEPGGIEGLMRRNRALALWARRLLEKRLGLRPVCAEAMLGAMAAFELPPDAAVDAGVAPPMPGAGHPLNDELFERFGNRVRVRFGRPPRINCCESRPRPTIVPGAIRASGRCAGNVAVVGSVVGLASLDHPTEVRNEEAITRRESSMKGEVIYLCAYDIAYEANIAEIEKKCSAWRSDCGWAAWKTRRGVFRPIAP